MKRLAVFTGIIFALTTHNFAKAPIYAKMAVLTPPVPQVEEIPIEDEEPPERDEIQPEKSIYDSCITTARALGLDIPPVGYAKNIIPNTNRSEVGNGVLFYAPPYGHVAVILEVLEDGKVLIGEGNWEAGKYTERVISLDSPKIKGFVSY